MSQLILTLSLLQLLLLLLLPSSFSLIYSFSYETLLSTLTSSGQPFSSLPRFTDMLNYHKNRSLSLYKQEYTLNLLQGGKETGPLGRRRNGQVVRVLNYFPGLEGKVFWSDQTWITAIIKNLPSIKSEYFNAQIPSSHWSSFRCQKGPDFSLSTNWSHLELTDNFSTNKKIVDILPVTYNILRDIAGERLGPRHIAIARQREGGIPLHR